jgi:hypothetical protein
VLLLFNRRLTSLHGTVTDPSGAAVPDTQVTADNNATGTHLTRTTDTKGEYSFLQITPGRYVVTVLRTGFGSQSKETEFLVDQPATINFTLSVQESKTTGEVSAEAQTLNLTDATIGNSVNNLRWRRCPWRDEMFPTCSACSRASFTWAKNSMTSVAQPATPTAEAELLQVLARTKPI